MDSIMKPTPSEAHPETMDFLSNTWCNFAVQALQPQLPDHSSIVLLEDTIKKFDCETKMEKSVKIDNSEFKSLPPWKSNDVKSWIWMQQAMHPELNYNRRKWMPWKIGGLKTISIRKWIKEIKQKRKEEERLQKAEVHAAVSVAGVAAALAAIAAQNSTKDCSKTTATANEDAVASAAALVAAHCAKVAESMVAKRDQLSTAIGSAITSTSTTDILTLTAAASTSLRGEATLKARTECKHKLNGRAPVLSIVENNEPDFDFDRWKSILANGTQLHVETPDGNFGVRSVSIFFNSQAKVILRMRKLNLLKSKKESIILDLHAEYYKASEDEQEYDTCYLIVLTTNQGIIKLDMGDDYHRYKTWATAINHMLMLSTSCTKYDLQFYKN